MIVLIGIIIRTVVGRTIECFVDRVFSFFSEDEIRHTKLTPGDALKMITCGCIVKK